MEFHNPFFFFFLRSKGDRMHIRVEEEAGTTGTVQRAQLRKQLVANPCSLPFWEGSPYK
jgi:hypothetical protein